ARLGHAGDQTAQGCLAKGQAGKAELAQVPMPAPAHGAAVDQAHRAGITRQFSQPRVIPFGFQLGADGSIFPHRRGLSLVSLNPGFFCHKTYFPSAKGMPMSLSSSIASPSVRAEVTMVMSMPCCRLILS